MRLNVDLRDKTQKKKPEVERCRRSKFSGQGVGQLKVCRFTNFFTLRQGEQKKTTVCACDRCVCAQQNGLSILHCVFGDTTRIYLSHQKLPTQAENVSGPHGKTSGATVTSA